MGENDLGGHAAKDAGHGQAEEEEVLLAQQARVWGGEPGGAGAGEEEHGDPVEKNRRNRQVLIAASVDDVDDAGR